MERLEVKRIKGKEYYYYSEWGRKDGKCRRLWQKYIGTGQAIVEMAKAKDGEHPKALCAELFQFGLPVALWNESLRVSVIQVVDKHCKKRDRKLSVGHYIALAAINRAASAVSKTGMWEWFSQTSLIRLIPTINKNDLSSQRFWDKMDVISSDDCKAIWNELLHNVIRDEQIDLSSISYDGTNYYTFIDTFNVHCSMAKRGKNKQGRANLRQINYSLFCTADHYIPLLYDVFEGNQNDYTHFPTALSNLQNFLQKAGNGQDVKEKTTIVFDKGNCSKNNFHDIDASEFYYVTSAKLGEHQELASISNKDSRFEQCSKGLDRTKSFRIRKNIHGKERTVIVTYNANLFECQWNTLQADMEKAIVRLSEIRRRLEDRENGLTKRGKGPSISSIKAQCKEILSREYLKQIIVCSITTSGNGMLKLEYSINQEALKTIGDTYLGKNIILTNRAPWSNDDIIRAYRSQYPDFPKNCS